MHDYDQFPKGAAYHCRNCLLDCLILIPSGNDQPPVNCPCLQGRASAWVRLPKEEPQLATLRSRRQYRCYECFLPCLLLVRPVDDTQPCRCPWYENQIPAWGQEKDTTPTISPKRLPSGTFGL